MRTGTDGAAELRSDFLTEVRRIQETWAFKEIPELHDHSTSRMAAAWCVEIILERGLCRRDASGTLRFKRGKELVTSFTHFFELQTLKMNAKGRKRPALSEGSNVRDTDEEKWAGICAVEGLRHDSLIVSLSKDNLDNFSL